MTDNNESNSNNNMRIKAFSKKVEEFLDRQGIGENLIKVALLLVSYFFLVLIMAEGRLVANTVLLLGFVAVSLAVLYFGIQWSRIICLWRSEISKILPAALSAFIALGLFIYVLIASEMLHGWFDVHHVWLIAMTSAGLFVIAYISNYLLSLSAKYKREYEQISQEKVRAERFKAELITNVSHDIQTPLTSIINYVDLLKNLSPKDKEFKKKFEEYTEVLDRKSARLKVLTTDLVEASKAATGNTAVNFQAVNFTEVIWQVAGEFDEQFKEQNLSFVFNPGTAQFVVGADSAHLWRILENLFGNAAKYSLAGTRVFAELMTLSDGMVKLSLKNISNEPLDQCVGELSEQFIRGDAARHTEGSGLGLYITKSLAELMGGSLSISVSGDQFEVVLLLKPSAIQQVSAPQLDGT